MTTQPPRTLREKLTQEREYLYTQFYAMQGALQELISGEATASYTIGNRSTSVTRANLNDLSKALTGIQHRIAEIEALLSGRAARSVQQHSYLQPQISYWIW